MISEICGSWEANQWRCVSVSVSVCVCGVTFVATVLALPSPFLLFGANAEGGAACSWRVSNDDRIDGWLAWVWADA